MTNSCSDQMKKDWKIGSIHAQAQNHARTLAETPGNQMTPRLFIDYAQDILQNQESIKMLVRDKQWIEQQRMGSFLSVSKGSDQDPFLLEIEYTGNTSVKASSSVALVGKGSHSQFH